MLIYPLNFRSFNAVRTEILPLMGMAPPIIPYVYCVYRTTAAGTLIKYSMWDSTRGVLCYICTLHNTDTG
jgi:hypothetical protein